MNVKVQIPDSVYRAMLSSSIRMQGSLGLVSPKEGNFHYYQRTTHRRRPRKRCYLPHGTANIYDDDVCLRLSVKRDDMPHLVIKREGMEAACFVGINN